MKFFSKKETLTQNITYMGIMAAINVVCVVLMTYVLPGLFIPFTLLLPFTSTVVSLYCDRRYFPLYAIATIGICFLTTINNISDTLFFIIPSIFSGFFFGLFIFYKFPTIITIFFTGLLYTGLSYLFIPIIQAIYNQNMIYVVSSIFKLNDYVYLSYIVPVFLFILGLLQSTFSLFFIKNELPKIGIKNEEKDFFNIHLIIGLFGSLMSFISYLLFPSFSLFFLSFALFFAVYQVFLDSVNHHFKTLIIYGILLAIFIVFFALIYTQISKPHGLLTLNILFSGIFIISLVNFYLTKTTK